MGARIHFFPSASDSLADTHPHQLYNRLRKGSTRRDGEICVSISARWTGLRVGDEPFEPERRLAWHARRALRWLQDAATGALVLPGDPFELPDFSVGDATCAYLEDEASFAAWQQEPARVGVASLFDLAGVSLVASFSDSKGREVRRASWGSPSRKPTVGAMRSGSESTASQ